MQNTSALYDEIIRNENHWFEPSVSIGESGVLVDEHADRLVFGNITILIDTGGPTSGFTGEQIFSLETNNSVFTGNVPEVGNAVSAEIDLRMKMPVATLPRMAQMQVFTRATDGTKYSEWIAKGTFFIDTREKTENDDGLDIITIHGYDAMLKAEQDYPSDSANNYPMLDIDMARKIADTIGVGVDPRTVALMNKGYTFPLPIGYSCREMLRYIAASYGGSFIISDENQLLLVKLGGFPAETNYLIDHIGDILVFGDIKILI